MLRLCQKRFLSVSLKAFEEIPIQKPNFDWFEEKVYNAELNTLPAKLPRWMDKSNLEKRKRLDIQKTGPVEVEEIVAKLDEMAAINVNVIDVKEKVDHFETVVICEGRSTRHVYSIADSIRIMVSFHLIQSKHRYVPGAFMPPNLAIEGKDNEEWLVLDLGKIIVHCFTAEARREMDLDSLWTEEFQSIHEFHSGESTREYLRGGSYNKLVE
jgi:ribosome silencing factor RsfS/YbeB/iojap